jgi:predicted RNase H-like HicB family nuclease
MKLSLDILIEKDEDGYYVASVPALPGCHTQSKSLDELMERAREAVELYIETDKNALKRVKSQFVGLQMLEVSA